jgi:hypothetical protein
MLESKIKTTVRSKKVEPQLVSWEVVEVNRDGELTVTSLLLKNERVFRFIRTFDPVVDKDQHDRIVQRHGPLRIGKMHFFEEYQ